MNCHTVAATLDERSYAALDAEARASLEGHGATCAECAAALEAARALALDRVPSVARPLDWAVIAARLQPPAPAARASGRYRPSRTAALAAVLGLGGAVFAAVGYYAAQTPSGGVEADAPAAAPGVPTQALFAAGSDGEHPLVEYVREADRESQAAFVADLMSAPLLPDGDYFPLLKVAPVYPQAAAEAGLEGSAVVEFTVTADGSVEEARIVESTDALFEASTLEAANRFRYKPRIVAGRPVAVTGVRNKITYVLDYPPGANAASTDEATEGQPDGELTWEQYRAMLSPAQACLDANDLRCAELALDELSARADVPKKYRAGIWNIYGFIHYRRGDRQRAIEAYRRAAELYPSTGYGNVLPLSIVAQLHYEQHQYQEALDAAIEYLKRSQSPSVGDYVFVDRLRQLGAQVR